MRYGHQARYWSTKVDLFDSKAQLEKWLYKQGCRQAAVVWDADQQRMRAMFVTLDGESYCIEDKPLPVQVGVDQYHSQHDSAMANARKTALNQMGRRLLEHVKIIIDLAEEGHPELLEAYRALPGGGPTFQQLGMKGLLELLQNSQHLALSATTGSAGGADFEEVHD